MNDFVKRMRVDFQLVWHVFYNHIVARPQTFVVFLVLMGAIIVLLQWLFNLETLRFILDDSNGLSGSDQLEVLIDAFVNVFKFANGIVPISMILIGAFQSATILLLLSLRKALSKQTALSLRSTLLALVGSGCVACSGSVLTPLLAIIASNVSTTLAQRLGDAVLIASVILSYRALSQSVFAYSKLKVSEG